VRKILLVASLVTVVGVMLASSVSAQDVPTGAPVDRSTHMTFSGPVSLPHVSLPAGTYLFRLVDVNNSHVLQVLSDDGKVSYAMVDTIPIERTPEAAKNGEAVTFKEAPATAPRTLDAWFYGDTEGCEMIYGDSRAD
jgi:hypothetical protein